MAQQAARIVRDDVMDGEPRVDGRRITVLRVQGLVETRGLPAAEVAAMHDLDVADVYAALTYYYEHPDEIASIQEQRENREQTARDAGAPTIEELAVDHEETG
ncbi:DUF433 domain-containing protein [Saliphagus infecundisoli]|uniref:DUF433 domain-containing protein n=1 Tax=Saliphagus infecundisoli TaxID=1849069 RepID=A0ABD5Q9A2_9EURY|nr:DUF433 domain-containing protein [Saliphagus infecundisoli]